MSLIEVNCADLERTSLPLAAMLQQGQVVVLRGLKGLLRFREELLRCAVRITGRPETADSLLQFYSGGETPSIPDLHALVVAIKVARTQRFLSECLADAVSHMGFESPVLLDGGVNRLVLPREVVEETRNHPALFVPTDYRRLKADGTPEIFMPGPSNIHRDFDRTHHLLMCNVWAPLHDADETQIVQVYPEAYRQPAA